MLVHNSQKPYIRTIDAIWIWVASITAPQRTGRQGPRPAGIRVLLGRAGGSSTQRQEPLPYLCDLECGAGGWEKRNIATAKKSAACPNPNRMRKTKMKNEKCGWAWSWRSHRAVQIADLSGSSTPATPSHTPTPAAIDPSHCGGGELGSHTSQQQAGAKCLMRYSTSVESYTHFSRFDIYITGPAKEKWPVDLGVDIMVLFGVSISAICIRSLHQYRWCNDRE